MRAIWLTAALCGFGAGLVAFPILVAHLEWPGIFVTLMGATFCVLGALSTAWLTRKSQPITPPPQS